MEPAASNRASRYLGPQADKLLFLRMSGEEILGRPYRLEVDLVSEQGGVQPAALLGEPAAVEFVGREKYRRYFHGRITATEAAGFDGRFHRYRVTLEPWLALLDYVADCRVFQELTAVEIIEAVFQKHGYSDFELALNDQYATRTYCVQYQESSLAFVSRLMEEEGIYYYFRHEKSKHVLVLADDPSSHSADSRHTSLPFHAAEASGNLREDHVSRLTASGRLTSGPVSTTSFDFTAPRKNLVVSGEVAFEPSLSQYERFDYNGRYAAAADGEHIARVRAQAEHARREIYRGEADAPAVAVGNLLSITGHPERAFNREYLVTSLRAEVEGDDYQGRAPEVEYRCAFTLVPSSVVYRSAQTTHKPMVRGLQTALVVGKSGEEIWTDEHGRVKVHFHWNRHDKSDENSSCWVRVSQIHAGSAWGGIDLPRVGEEVVVAFEDGDPDRPVVIGRLYNGEAKPPYALPDGRTRSGMKSNSSKGGGGFNEWRFEDKKGEEEVYLRAEKDFNALVQNDRSLEIGNDQSHDVKNDDKVTIGKDQTTEIGQNQKIDIGKKLDVNAGDQITLKTGQSKIVMKKNGDIEISGVNIKVKGMKLIDLKSNLNLKAQGTLVDVKANGKLTLKATLLDMGANALAKLKGALTMIG